MPRGARLCARLGAAYHRRHARRYAPGVFGRGHRRVGLRGRVRHGGGALRLHRESIHRGRRRVRHGRRGDHSVLRAVAEQRHEHADRAAAVEPSEERVPRDQGRNDAHSRDAPLPSLAEPDIPRRRPLARDERRARVSARRRSSSRRRRRAAEPRRRRGLRQRERRARVGGALPVDDARRLGRLVAIDGRAPSCGACRRASCACSRRTRSSASACSRSSRSTRAHVQKPVPRRLASATNATGASGTRSSRLSLVHAAGALVATTDLACFGRSAFGYEQFTHELLFDADAPAANDTGALATIRMSATDLALTSRSSTSRRPTRSTARRSCAGAGRGARGARRRAHARRL